MSTIPQFTIRDLLEAGVHYGHRTMRWNPKMAPYLYGVKDNSHIIDLQQTAPYLHNALKAVFDVAKKNGKILFVGTKMQASDIVKEAAERSGQYYVNHRWLGGMVTNWGTVSASIRTMEKLEEKIKSAEESNIGKYTKKEILDMQRKKDKLELSLGGIREMNGKPDLLFVIDTNKESIAIKEAKVLGIPVIAILDSNSNPDDITYPVPGNDDATRAIKLYCKLMSDSILSGIQASMIEAGVEISDLQDLDAIKDIAARAKEDKKNARPANNKFKRMPDNRRVTPKGENVAAEIKAEAAPNYDEVVSEDKDVKAAKPAKKAAPAAEKKDETAAPKKPAAKKTKKDEE